VSFIPVGLPKRLPCAFRWFILAFVLSLMSSLSSSATAARIVKKNLPCGLDVSMFCVTVMNCMFLFLNSSILNTFIYIYTLLYNNE